MPNTARIATKLPARTPPPSPLTRSVISVLPKDCSGGKNELGANQVPTGNRAVLGTMTTKTPDRSALVLQGLAGTNASRAGLLPRNWIGLRPSPCERRPVPADIKQKPRNISPG